MVQSNVLTRTILVAVLAATASAATAADMAPKAPAAAPAAGDAVTLTNHLEGGKKVWTPNKLSLHAGAKAEIKLVNTLSEPHGFSVPGLVDPVVVGPHETKVVTVVSPKAGTYKFMCQLHPAHVGGELDVK